MAWIGAAIAGGAMVGGALINSASQNAANDKNIELAREQMKFQKDMSNTAWQRGVADMKKAGVNPMLAFSQGGASSPSGSQGRVEATRPGDALSQGVNSAITAKRDLSLVDLQTAQVQQSTAQAMATLADARLKESTALQVQQQTRNLGLEAAALKLRPDEMMVGMRLKDAQDRKTRKESTRLDQGQDAHVAQSDLERDRARNDRQWLEYDQLQKRLQRTFDTAGSAMDVVKPFRGLKGTNGKTPSGPETTKQLTERMRRMWEDHKRSQQ